MKKLFFIVGLLVLSLFQSRASIVINELMPRNVSYLINDNFNFEGWVEVYNSGSENFNLSDCVFSDGENTWESEIDTILAPGGYFLFFFDELNSYNHASFKLDSDGGLLILTDKKGGELDRVVYSSSFRNVSYGRIKDGDTEFGHLVIPSPYKSNNGISTKVEQSESPCFSPSAGFYDETQLVKITSTAEGAKIYYTLDGTEPQVSDSLLYKGEIEVSKNTPIRAIAVEEGKFPSEMSTSSYFINNRKISLPVVSIVTDPKMFYDDSIGLIVVGVNGKTEIPSYCSYSESYANFWEDWDRPCNFEIFDENEKAQQISMEVKAGNFGACSRTKLVKSIKLNASKVYGGGKMNYSIFKEKPNLKWKSVVLRNSGNDFGRSYLRDGFMQSLLIGQVDIDHQAYQPSIVYINGEYYGLLNIRERTNKDFVYSNYGLDEDEIFIETNSSSFSTESGSYDDVASVCSSEDMNADGIYEKVCNLIDLNEFLNYFMAEVYYANTDWAGGNLKYWKRKENGKWRWILYDTDFGYSCYGANYSSNTFSNAAKNVTFSALMKNDKIKERYISKFVVHLATTFNSDRCIKILDSMSSYIKDEALIYSEFLDEKVEANWSKDIENMKTFAKERPANVFSHIASYFGLGSSKNMRIYSETPNTQFVFNEEPVKVSDLNSNYYVGSNVKLTAVPADGQIFDHWEVSSKKMMLYDNAEWKYYDGGKDLSTIEWSSLSYDDSDWKSGVAPLGFGLSKVVKTTTSNKNGTDYVETTYFRNTLNIEDVSKLGTLKFTIGYNDGAIVYINGNEVKRINMPDGAVDASTHSIKSVSAKAVTETFSVEPSEYFVDGNNVIAVEVHNTTPKNSTLAFYLNIEDEQNNKIVRNVNSLTLNEQFSDETEYKAVFTPDPEYDINTIKLYLNEICVTNKQYVDEYREDEDWIEIYNDGCEPVNLAGMYLSDERKDLRKFQISEDAPELTTIPAKGYLIFWADGQPEQGALHTNFSLPLTRQQTVSLSRVVGGELFVIDSIRYTPHINDESFARFAYTGFESDWKITSRPTFNAENVFFDRVDVEEFVADGDALAIYPNPTQDNIWFYIPWDGRANVQIYDGIHCLLNTDVANGEGIEMSKFESGLYFAIVTSADGMNRQVIKILKK